MVAPALPGQERQKATPENVPRKASVLTARVLTKDDLTASPAPPNQTATTDAAAAAADDSAKKAQEQKTKEEAEWRAKFAKLRHDIHWTRREISVLQLEFNRRQLQYYPNTLQTLAEEYTRDAIHQHQSLIEKKKAELEDLIQKLDELEDQLRHAGLPPGWSREP